MSVSVLVIEDDATGRETLAEALRERGYRVRTATDGSVGLALLETEPADIVITDLMLPGADGMQILERAAPYCPVILITAYGTVDTAVQAMKRGAFDFVTKPVHLPHIYALVERALQMRALTAENERLRARGAGEYAFEQMIGRTAAMRNVFQQIRQVAPTDTTVCILGESGTGKELIANAIHQHSRRAAKPFIKVNCAAIAETLLESELFGHEKGSFTGAIKQRKGRFELADGGTILLDEIAEMSPALQAKLLRVLQEQTFERVGGTDTISVDVRVLVATNADLRERIKAGAFREDLYYRVSVFPIQVPPLRERREDIPLLADHFLRQRAAAMGKPLGGIAPAALDALTGYAWPGNVRQLENAIERACVMAPAGANIDAAHLPPEVLQVETPQPAGTTSLTSPTIAAAPPSAAAPALPVATMDELEKMAIEQALRRCNGNRAQAARTLKIGAKTLYRKIEKYGITL
jgi:two-component system response regulator HydG